MPVRNLNVGEARRELPRLVRQVSSGGGAIAIGPRGRPAAVLIGAEEYDALRGQARSGASSGWAGLRLELVGTLADLEADLRAIRRGVEPTLPSMGRRSRRK